MQMMYKDQEKSLWRKLIWLTLWPVLGPKSRRPEMLFPFDPVVDEAKARDTGIC